MLLNTTINLLPSEKKNLLERIVKVIFVRDILEVLILVYTLLAIVLVWSWIVLQEDYNNLAESAASVNREYSKQNQEIKKLNSLIKSVDNASIGYLPMAPKISDIISQLPNNIKITSLNIDRKTNTFTISGSALTRSDLINYQQTIKKIPWLEKIDTPNSQLFQKENIIFELKGKLKNFPILFTEVKAKPNKPVNNADSF